MTSVSKNVYIDQLECFMKKNFKKQIKNSSELKN